MDREELRLERVDAMEEASNRLDGPVKQYLSGELSEDELYKSILTVFTDQWNADFGLFDRLVDAWDWFREQIKPGIDKIVPDSVPRTVADWLGTVIVNGSRAAKSDDGLMWLSRRDNRVRPKHITADGQVVRVGEPFQVGGYDVPFPGAPVGPPELWLNCRCAAVPASMVASVDGYAQWDVISGRSGDAPLPSEVLLAGAGAALPPTVGPDEPLPGVAAFAGVSSGSPSGWV